MRTLNKESLIKIGGVEWSKGGMNRVYLNKNALKSLFTTTALTDFQKKSIAKSRTYYDIDEDVLVSDIGTIRVMLRQEGYNVAK